MKQTVVIWIALAVYGLVAACVLAPIGSTKAGQQASGERTSPALNGVIDNNTPEVQRVDRGANEARDRKEGLPFRSVTMQIQRVDWIDKYKQSLDEIADLGADTVMFVIDTRQENGRSGRIWLDMRQTPTVDQLTDLIKTAKAKKLRVIIMPIVLLDKPEGSEWRGTIKPDGVMGWADWWDSYRAMITHFAEIAEWNHADMLVVGSELVSTEANVKEWTKTIQAVRKLYKGKLTYSSNWDHYTSVPFWDQLDMVGMNSYWKMGEKDERPTVDDIKQRWTEIQSDLLSFVRKTRKPLMFLEIGWFSQRNVPWEPWNYTKPIEDEPIDLDVQKRLYQAFFESWYGRPELGGFSIWEWTPGDGGPENSGYTPENKPAEHVLREWFAKPRWEVK